MELNLYFLMLDWETEIYFHFRYHQYFQRLHLHVVVIVLRMEVKVFLEFPISSNNRVVFEVGFDKAFIFEKGSSALM